MIVDTKNLSPRLTPWAFSFLHNRKEHWREGLITQPTQQHGVGAKCSVLCPLW
nr:MAG TPA: hypothetical protein [Caudoviricetes sp.]